MAGFDAEVPHGLGQQAAQEKLKGFIDRVRTQYQDQVSDLSETWNDNVLTFSMTAYSITISGDLTILDDKVVVAGKMPFFALPYKGRIAESITSELKKALAE